MEVSLSGCQNGVTVLIWAALCRPADKTISTDRSEDLSGWLKLRSSSVSIVNKIEEIAKARNVSMAQVALAWSLSKPFVSAPIIGTTSLEKLDDLIAGCSLELSADEIKSIDDLYESGPIIGH